MERTYIVTKGKEKWIMLGWNIEDIKKVLVKGCKIKEQKA